MSDEALAKHTDAGSPHLEFWEQKLPELVSTGDIARMAGVHVQAVSNWKQRYVHPKRPGDKKQNPNGIPKFPNPVVITGAGPLYAKNHIEQWLSAREKAQA